MYSVQPELVCLLLTWSLHVQEYLYMGYGVSPALASERLVDY